MLTDVTALKMQTTDNYLTERHYYPFNLCPKLQRKFNLSGFKKPMISESVCIYLYILMTCGWGCVCNEVCFSMKIKWFTLVEAELQQPAAPQTVGQPDGRKRETSGRGVGWPADSQHEGEVDPS